MPRKPSNELNADEDYKITLQVDIVNSSYHYAKRLLSEYDDGLTYVDYHTLRRAKRIVSRVESSLEMLPDKLKIIMKAEVINNKRGTKWYTEYFSIPSYYRNRKKAYKLFNTLVNR